MLNGNKELYCISDLAQCKTMLKNVVDYQNSTLLTAHISTNSVDQNEIHRVQHFITIPNVDLTETIFRGRDKNSYNLDCTLIVVGLDLFPFCCCVVTFAMEFCQ